LRGWAEYEVFTVKKRLRGHLRQKPCLMCSTVLDVTTLMLPSPGQEACHVFFLPPWGNGMPDSAPLGSNYFDPAMWPFIWSSPETMPGAFEKDLSFEGLTQPQVLTEVAASEKKQRRRGGAKRRKAKNSLQQPDPYSQQEWGWEETQYWEAPPSSTEKGLWQQPENCGDKGGSNEGSPSGQAVLGACSEVSAAPRQVGLQLSGSFSPPFLCSWRRPLPTVPESPTADAAGEPEETGGDGIDEEDPLKLAETKEGANKILERLESNESRKTLLWLKKALRPMSLDKHGCRVVQRALEIAPGELRTVLLAELEPHVVELYESANGNHVLSKVIEVIPGAKLRGLVAKLEEKGWEHVAKHRFGCRALERLIEHSSESELQGLIGMVKEKCEELSRHQFGNFVVQHLFEHQASCRPDLLKPLLCKMSELAMHRTASHVVQSALYHCEEEGQKDIVESLLRATCPSPAIEQVAMGRYGSYVAEQLATLPSSWVQSVDLKQRLKSSLVELCAAENGFGRRVAEKFGLVDCVPLQQPKAQAPDI